MWFYFVSCMLLSMLAIDQAWAMYNRTTISSHQEVRDVRDVDSKVLMKKILSTDVSVNSSVKPVTAKYAANKEVLIPSGTFEEIMNRTTFSKGSRAQPKKGSLFCFLFAHPKHFSRPLIDLGSELREICWRMMPEGDEHVPVVSQTWLPRCDRGEFFVSRTINVTANETDPETYREEGEIGITADSDLSYTTVFGDIPDDRPHLLAKGLFALHFAYKAYPDFDWYFKADSDTYVIVKNLRKYLATLDHTKPYYVGYRMNYVVRKIEHGYNSGGAGYALSKAAMKIFEEQLFLNRTLCPPAYNEDVGIGSCFANVGIYPHDTRTEKGQQRFNAYKFDQIFEQKIHQNYIFDKYNTSLKGPLAVPDDLISVHHLYTNEMLTYDVLLNVVK